MNLPNKITSLRIFITILIIVVYVPTVKPKYKFELYKSAGACVIILPINTLSSYGNKYNGSFRNISFNPEISSNNTRILSFKSYSKK